MGRQEGSALPIPNDLNRGLVGEILREPAAPFRFRDPFHKALSQGRDPQMAVTVFESGEGRKAAMVRAIVEIELGSQAAYGLAQKPDLAVPAGQQRIRACRFP